MNEKQREGKTKGRKSKLKEKETDITTQGRTRQGKEKQSEGKSKGWESKEKEK